MDKLVLHPHTLANLHSLANNPPQALLLSGPKGIGKNCVATAWAETKLQVPATRIRYIAPAEKTGISIDQIRSLYQATRTKHTARQIFILDPADSMSVSAQNAFLKLLEEPGRTVHFILTASRPENLLPTIRSRLQQVQVHPVGKQDLLIHLQKTTTLPAATVQQIAFIADGKVGLATQLANDPKSLEAYRGWATKAKAFLTGTSFERLLLLLPFKERGEAMTFLELTGSMAATLLSKAHTPKEQAKWLRLLHGIHETLERLHSNANIRIQLTRLALTL